MIAGHSPRRATYVIAALLAASIGAPLAVARGDAERYTALAVNIGDSPVPWTTLTVDMVVNRWSTDAERDRLLSTLMEQGPDKLLDVLREMPRVGYIRTPDSIGYDLKFARKQPLPDGGERVVLATDRYITLWEAMNRPRTIDYPFTVIELRVGPSGEGDGKMSLFAKIIADKKNNMIVLEDYGTQPVLLKSVRKATN